MPELPEVETIRVALEPHLRGRRILRVDSFVDKLRYPVDPTVWPGLCDARIMDLRRRGRYLLVDFDPTGILLLHLGMTGAFRIVPQTAEKRPHEHVWFALDNGMSWRFLDPRRFGFVEFYPDLAPGAVPARLAGLGPEPLSAAFHTDYFHDQCRDRQRPIKPLLMENRCVAGVGNIYASESLFRARIHPRTPAARLSRRRAERLVDAVRSVLRDAIRAGGTTLSDFRSVDGTEGKFRAQLDVYGREGEPCHRDAHAVVRRVVMAGRSTYFCPRCQRY